MDRETRIALEENLEQILQDSMDVDWTCAAGAKAIVHVLEKHSNGKQHNRECLDWLLEATS